MKEDYSILAKENQRLFEEVDRLNRVLKKNVREIRIANSLLDKVTKGSVGKDTLNTALSNATIKQRSYTEILLQSCPNIIILFDPDGRLVLSTEIFLSITNTPNFNFMENLKYEEIFSRYFSATQMEEFKAAYYMASMTNEVILFDALVDFTGKGEPRYYKMELRRTGTGLVNKAFNTVGILVVMIDLTDLMREKQSAETASSAKSNFLATMSHEIRTPLNAIIGMTAIGKIATNPERKNYAFDKVEEASHHLLGVINDILDMSKIEANKLELSHVEFSFENILHRTANFFSFRIDEKKQKFSVHIDQAIPDILIGDDHRLMQVITNLVGNAVKFTPVGGSISVDTKYLAEENSVCFIEVTISDTGIGISEAHKNQLFDTFQQGESNTTRQYGGTGLGLAISKNIVEMMSGSIWFESEPGKGSTFKFTFKARRSSGRNEENSKNTTTWSGLSFMFVDDDPVILEYAEEIMRRFGVSCDTASSGEEALERVKQNGGYNVYFVDWKMPGMDGIALTRALKAIKSDKGNTVIIMISSVDMELIEGEAKKAGADKFLMKPLFPSAIVNAINEALGNAYDTTVAGQDDLSRLFMGYRILLAEDMEINREIVMALFESTQVEIDCVENGEEAVRAFSASPEKYNMIFMDVQMPVMDGYEATLAIRSLDNPSAKTIPIVAMTADVFQEDIQKARASGMNAHIGKPLDFNEIWEVMKTLLLGTKD